jgi:hypothetical protein
MNPELVPAAPETPGSTGRGDPPIAAGAGAADSPTASGTDAGECDALVFAFVAKALREPQHRRFERAVDVG